MMYVKASLTRKIVVVLGVVISSILFECTSTLQPLNE
jgi:hypothetical protein